MAKARPKVPSSTAPSRARKPANPGSGASDQASDTRLKFLICLLLIVATVVAYGQIFGCAFVTCFDDRGYVVKNPFITKGLGPSSLAWAFSTFRSANWHPLTWISHMVDYQIYGLNPTGHHLTSLLFHVANTLILFLVLSRMTGAFWKSAFVASLFALHPMHVESVAWAAERKDVLSTFFWLTTMYAYVLYARRPSIARYVPVMVAFALALMSKPMPVSLPIVLLLLDYWPLDRANLKWKLVWEKAPLLAMSAASSVVTFFAQRSGGAVVSTGDFAFGYRIGNAAISYIAYILKMVWPSGLVAFYPHPAEEMPIWMAIGAGIALAGVTLLVIRHGRRRPYLPVGWLWYLITMVPVIGLVQVGGQAMADRYSYITLTGLFIIVAWGIPDLISRFRSVSPRLLTVSALVVTLALAALTWSQVRVWQNDYTLFDHAVRVSKDNAIAYHLRGKALHDRARYEEAIRDFSQAIVLEPGFAAAHNSLGAESVTAGKIQVGIHHLQTALRLGMNTSEVRHNLAVAYLSLGNLDAAARECRTALSLGPENAESHNMMAVILSKQSKSDEAIAHFRTATELDPTYPDPHANLAIAYYSKGDYASAWRELHLYQSKGGQPDPQMIAELSRSMPDPGP